MRTVAALYIDPRGPYPKIAGASKPCRRCGSAERYPRSATGGGGGCKPCGKRAAMARWRNANRERVRAAQRDWRKRTNYNASPKRKAEIERAQFARYGITRADFDALLLKQASRCAICGSTSPRVKGMKRLYVDHCHASGSVRGLLCGRCNSLLGNAGDSTELLRSALAYLEGAK